MYVAKIWEPWDHMICTAGGIVRCAEHERCAARAFLVIHVAPMSFFEGGKVWLDLVGSSCAHNPSSFGGFNWGTLQIIESSMTMASGLERRLVQWGYPMLRENLRKHHFVESEWLSSCFHPCFLRRLKDVEPFETPASSSLDFLLLSDQIWSDLTFSALRVETANIRQPVLSTDTVWQQMKQCSVV